MVSAGLPSTLGNRSRSTPIGLISLHDMVRQRMHREVPRNIIGVVKVKQRVNEECTCETLGSTMGRCQ